MSRKLIFFFLIHITTALVSWAQPGLVWPTGTEGKDYNVTDAKGKRQGPWIRVHASNPKVLYYRGQFKDGVPTGSWEWYYETGNLMTTMVHVQGDVITDNINYYADGKTRMSEGRFVKKTVEGKMKRCREGVWNFYGEYGQLKAEEHYADSLQDGVCKYFYDSGQLSSIVNFTKGLREGPFTDYHDNGKKMREGAYLRGDFEGPFTMWYENGTKEVEGQYVKGLKDGTWTHYKNSGAIEMRVLYKMGKEVKRQYMEGSNIEYYDSGIPKCEYTWEDGKKNGPFKEWYDKGKFVQVPVNSEDAKIGITYREKLEGTQLMREGDFVDDKLEGEITLYDEEGNIIAIEVYVDGVLKEKKPGGK